MQSSSSIGSHLLLLSSISSVLTLFVVSTIAVIVVAMDNGWPKVRIVKMGAKQMANCLAAIFGSYFVLLFISCSSYGTVAGWEKALSGIWKLKKFGPARGSKPRPPV